GGQGDAEKPEPAPGVQGCCPLYILDLHHADSAKLPQGFSCLCLASSGIIVDNVFHIGVSSMVFLKCLTGRSQIRDRNKLMVIEFGKPWNSWSFHL
ncbi:mCG1034816, partial [Mus musculus]